MYQFIKYVWNDVILGWVLAQCPYFDILDQVLGTRPNITPPAVLSTQEIGQIGASDDEGDVSNGDASGNMLNDDLVSQSEVFMYLRSQTIDSDLSALHPNPDINSCSSLTLRRMKGLALRGNCGKWFKSRFQVLVSKERRTKNRNQLLPCSLK
jgi:hypothetical protein